MLSKNQVKLISSLKLKKYRYQHKLFIVEGEKNIKEFLISNFELTDLFSTDDRFGIQHHLVTDKELAKISQLSTPNVALALFRIPETKLPSPSGLVVALDALRDPGNLGTIIRLCDWFGISDLLCSEDTVDCYNAKVVQSTMGSLSRVNIHYVNLRAYLSKSELPIYGTFMDGKNIYRSTLPDDAILLMGNEANGISKTLSSLVTNTLSIPRYNVNDKIESLNVAVATAICISEFRRAAIER